jgi:hypothetical protein
VDYDNVVDFELAGLFRLELVAGLGLDKDDDDVDDVTDGGTGIAWRANPTAVPCVIISKEAIISKLLNGAAVVHVSLTHRHSVTIPSFCRIW